MLSENEYQPLDLSKVRMRFLSSSSAISDEVVEIGGSRSRKTSNFTPQEDPKIRQDQGRRQSQFGFPNRFKYGFQRSYTDQIIDEQTDLSPQRNRRSEKSKPTGSFSFAPQRRTDRIANPLWVPVESAPSNPLSQPFQPRRSEYLNPNQPPRIELINSHDAQFRNSQLIFTPIFSDFRGHQGNSQVRFRDPQQVGNRIMKAPSYNRGRHSPPPLTIGKILSAPLLIFEALIWFIYGLLIYTKILISIILEELGELSVSFISGLSEFIESSEDLEELFQQLNLFLQEVKAASVVAIALGAYLIINKETD